MKKDKRMKRESRKYNFENSYQLERFKRKKELTQLILLVSSIVIMSIAAFSGFLESSLDFIIEFLLSKFK